MKNLTIIDLLSPNDLMAPKKGRLYKTMRWAFKRVLRGYGGHDGHTLGVDGEQVGVFEKTHDGSHEEQRYRDGNYVVSSLHQ